MSLKTNHNFAANALFLLLFCSFSLFVFSQNKRLILRIDSIEKLPAGFKKDTLLVKSLNELSFKLKQSNTDSAVLLSSQALQIAEKCNWVTGKGSSYMNLGVFFYYKGDYNKSIHNGLCALKVWEEMEAAPPPTFSLKMIYKKMAATLSNLSVTFKALGKDEEALAYLIKALESDKKGDYKWGMAIRHGNIGGWYADRAKWLKEQKTNSDSVMRLFEKARFHLEKSLALCEETKDGETKERAYNNLAVIYQENGRYDVALQYLNNARAEAEKKGNKISQAVVLLNIGNCLLKLGQDHKAENTFLQALSIVDETGDKDVRSDLCLHLSDYYQKHRRDELALNYYREHIRLKDSLFNLESERKNTQELMKYELEKKEKIEKLTRQKTEEIKKTELEQEKMRRNFMLTAFVLAILSILVILRGFFNKKKANLLLEEKNKLIAQQKSKVEEKQKEVLDSIRYAKRIQLTLLPGEKYIESALNRMKKAHDNH